MSEFQTTLSRCWMVGVALEFLPYTPHALLMWPPPMILPMMPYDVVREAFRICCEAGATQTANPSGLLVWATSDRHLRAL